MNSFELFLQIFFWVSAGLLFHNYFGTYLFLRILTALKRPATTIPGELSAYPRVTVAIAAYNEEAVIAQKIENLLGQDYPGDQLEIIVGSDLSNDRTDEIVKTFESRGVRLIRMKERSGKQGVLDEIIPHASGEIVIVTDANVMFEKQVVRRLARAYSKPQIGGASGYLAAEMAGAIPLKEEAQYRKFEARLRVLQGQLGVLVTGYGGIYSIRKECFRPFGPVPISEDVIAAMEVLGQKRQVVFVNDAIAHEETGQNIGEEIRKRVRNVGLTFNSISRVVRLGWRGGLLPLFVAVSYKILRWFSPHLLLVLLIAALLLAGHSLFYKSLAIISLAGLLAALVGWIIHRSGARLKPFTPVYYFLAMNYAGLAGVVHWLKGIKRYWTPRGL